MVTTVPGSPEEKAWAEGYNVALFLAARRLAQANDETKAACMIEEIRAMMQSAGPSSEEIEAMLGLRSPQDPVAESAAREALVPPADRGGAE